MMAIWNKNITGYNFMSYETINNIKNKSSGSLRSLLYTSSYYYYMVTILNNIQDLTSRASLI